MIVSDFSVLFESNWKPDLRRLKVHAAADRLIFEAQIDHFDMAVPLVSVLRNGLFEIDATGRLRGSLFEGSRVEIVIVLLTSLIFLLLDLQWITGGVCDPCGHTPFARATFERCPAPHLHESRPACFAPLGFTKATHRFYKVGYLTDVVNPSQGGGFFVATPKRHIARNGTASLKNNPHDEIAHCMIVAGMGARLRAHFSCSRSSARARFSCVSL